jgi:acyl-CoA thioester hydrolase
MPPVTDVRVYYEDTDAGGVVYYANHLKFAERGRTELLRFLGFENKSMLDKHGVIFVVRHLEANYIKPAFLDDFLKVDTVITEVKNASVVMKQKISRENQEIFLMNVTLVCVDMATRKPAGLPAKVRQEFEVLLKEGS